MRFSRKGVKFRGRGCVERCDISFDQGCCKSVGRGKTREYVDGMAVVVFDLVVRQRPGLAPGIATNTHTDCVSLNNDVDK